MKIFKSLLSIFVLSSCLFLFSLTAFAESYASPIYISTYLPEPVSGDNLVSAALHYKQSGLSYLLVVGSDGTEGLTFSFELCDKNHGNRLYATNTSNSDGFAYIYFISLDNCSISNIKTVKVPKDSRYNTIYSEYYEIDGYYSYGLPISCVGGYTIPYSLQVTWGKATSDNISTIRNEISGVNNKCQIIIDYLKSIDDDSSNIRERLIWTNTYLNNIDGNISQAISKLDSIISLLQQLINAEPSESVNQSQINDYNQANKDVDDLLGGLIESTSSNINNNIDMSGNNISWIYQQVEDIVKGNSKVFAVFLSILSMSLIMFIINKGANA